MLMIVDGFSSFYDIFWIENANCFVLCFFEVGKKFLKKLILDNFLKTIELSFDTERKREYGVIR